MSTVILIFLRFTKRKLTHIDNLYVHFLNWNTILLVSNRIARLSNVIPILLLLFVSILFSVCLYIFIQSKQELLFKKKAAEQELERVRTVIALSQIQPHFLYNALVSMKELCDAGEQQAASRAMDHFACYLRENLDSLSDTKLIPFEKELSHVKNYLFIEKLRFEEKLNIVWELEHIDFMLPPLTLQPIVENAVRHGITENKGGGTLTIHSERIAEKIMITVIDDGVGFDSSKTEEDGRLHVGIKNVQSRLRAQCGGSLDIESQPGAGTIARIILYGKEAVDYGDHDFLK